MGNFGGFYKGDKKKAKKSVMERKAESLSSQKSFVLPKIEIIPKGKIEKK